MPPVRLVTNLIPGYCTFKKHQDRSRLARDTFHTLCSARQQYYHIRRALAFFNQEPQNLILTETKLEKVCAVLGLPKVFA